MLYVGIHVQYLNTGRYESMMKFPPKALQMCFLLYLFGCECTDELATGALRIPVGG